jgi:predicted RNase H-like HicB family nuclease
MNPEIELKIELIPIIRQDKRTGIYVAYFEPFKKAMAAGSTPQEAMTELLQIFGVMLREKEDDMKKVIIERYYETAPKRSQKLKDVRVYA